MPDIDGRFNYIYNSFKLIVIKGVLVSPRRYRSGRRKAATEETRRKIVESTVDLHAEQGVLATTYAMIAKRADVAIPTVYNHFPTRGDLLAACTSQAAALAPPLGPQNYNGADDVDTRLQALVHALFAYYRHYAPWMRWANYEAQLVPELAEWLHEATDARRQLTELALEPAFGTPPPAALLALCEILLDYPAWQRLVSDQGFESAEAETALTDALTALVQMHRTAFTAAGRRSKPRTERNT